MGVSLLLVKKMVKKTVTMTQIDSPQRFTPHNFIATTFLGRPLITEKVYCRCCDKYFDYISEHRRHSDCNIHNILQKRLMKTQG